MSLCSWEVHKILGVSISCCDNRARLNKRHKRLADCHAKACGVRSQTQWDILAQEQSLKSGTRTVLLKNHIDALTYINLLTAFMKSWWELGVAGFVIESQFATLCQVYVKSFQSRWGQNLRRDKIFPVNHQVVDYLEQVPTGIYTGIKYITELVCVYDKTWGTCWRKALFVDNTLLNACLNADRLLFVDDRLIKQKLYLARVYLCCW